MVMRIGGARRKTRSKLSKNYRQKGKISLRRYLQAFSPGDHVALIAEPAIHEGTYFRRFHGASGTIKRKCGSCYEVSIMDMNKEKRIVVHPVHLRKVA